MYAASEASTGGIEGAYTGPGSVMPPGKSSVFHLSAAPSIEPYMSDAFTPSSVCLTSHVVVVPSLHCWLVGLFLRTAVKRLATLSGGRRELVGG